MLLHGDPDASPAPDNVQAQHINTCVPPPQGVVEDMPQNVAQDLGFGARAARALLATPPPPPPCLCAVRAEMGAQLGIWLGR